MTIRTCGRGDGTGNAPVGDGSGVGEGWLVVFDPDLTKSWDGKIYSLDIPWKGKTVHVIGC